MSSDVLSQSDVQIQHTECFINGEWVPAQSGKTFATVNPATEEEIAQIAEGDAEDVNLAAIAARKAWRKSDLAERYGAKATKAVARASDRSSACIAVNASC